MDTDVIGALTHEAGHPDGPVVCMFGGPYVRAGGRRHQVPEGSKQLLAFVALRRRRVDRRHVAGILWPNGNEERAAGNLRSALWRLRRAGIDVLLADKRSLALRADVLVDVHVVDQWATRLISGKASAADLGVPPFWADVLEFLPGWYDDWVLMERERLRQKMLHALEEVSRKLACACRFADAVEAAILAISAEPLRESAQRVLIEAHVAEGNLSEARRIWQDYRNLVHHELGVDPSGDLQAVLAAYSGADWLRPGQEFAAVRAQRETATARLEPAVPGSRRRRSTTSRSSETAGTIAGGPRPWL